MYLSVTYKTLLYIICVVQMQSWLYQTNTLLTHSLLVTFGCVDSLVLCHSCSIHYFYNRIIRHWPFYERLELITLWGMNGRQYVNCFVGYEEQLYFNMGYRMKVHGLKSCFYQEASRHYFYNRIIVKCNKFLLNIFISTGINDFKKCDLFKK